jgi:serine/threonine-protein kinase
MASVNHADPGLVEALSERYAIEHELGRGGMATVYLARDLKHQRPVALKVLHPELGAALGAERFLREIETTARLQHPNILPIFDSGDAAGRLWYTMPFVAGESLRDRLTRETRLAPAEATRLLSEVGSALDYAHRHGVVYRDIKPGNILLSDGHALVADFGIARSVGPDARETLTATGHSLGTPAYMAPEQAAGSVCDHRADIYALGCVLYELLTGGPPYVRSSAPAIIAAHMVEPVPDLSQARAGVPQALAAAVKRAMAKDPAQRFDSAAAFVAALNGVSGTSAFTVTVPVAATARRRLRGRLLPAAAALAFLAGIGVWMAQRSHRATTPTLLAVLPFENHGTPEDEPFVDGLADEAGAS